MKESKLQHTEQPQLFLSMHIAQYQLAQGQNAETKPALEEAKEKLASLNDVSLTKPMSQHSEAVHDGSCRWSLCQTPQHWLALDGEPVAAWTVSHRQHSLALCNLHQSLMCAHTWCPQVDPAVSAAVHYVSSLYYKAEQDFAEFYKSSLQYLAFVSSDQLEHEFKLVRARSGRCFVHHVGHICHQ